MMSRRRSMNLRFRARTAIFRYGGSSKSGRRNVNVSSRKESRAFFVPPHFGGRGTQRGLPAAGRDLLFAEQPRSRLVNAKAGGGGLQPRREIQRENGLQPLKPRVGSFPRAIYCTNPKFVSGAGPEPSGNVPNCASNRATFSFNACSSRFACAGLKITLETSFPCGTLGNKYMKFKVNSSPL